MLRNILEKLRYKIIINIIFVKKEPEILKFCLTCNKYKNIYYFDNESEMCNECKNRTPYEKIDEIIKIICKQSNIEYERFWSSDKTRDKEYVKVRQRAQFFAKKYTNLSLAKIGEYIHNKDHATVLHSCKTVNNLIDTDKFYSKEIDYLRSEILKKLS